MNVLKPMIILAQHAKITRRNFHSLPGYEHLFRQFHATYPDFKKYLFSQVDKDWAKKPYNEILDYMLRAGRQARPAIVLKAHEAMVPAYRSDAEFGKLQKIHVMAWIVETVEAAALVVDDYVDESELRRGQVPWYVGREKTIAAEAVMMSLTPYYLLYGWFKNDVFFHSAATLLQKHVFEAVALADKFEIQSLELYRKRNLTWDNYRAYATSKALYSVDLSFKLAAFESTKSSLQFDDLTNLILEDLSFLFQLENDAQNVIPKPGHFTHHKDLDEDIKSSKINFALTFLMNNTEEEDRAIAEANIGKNDQQCVDIIRGLYHKYDVPNEMKKYIENLQKSIRDKINMVSNERRFQDGLIAVLETIQLYLRSDPGAKHAYPKMKIQPPTST